MPFPSKVFSVEDAKALAISMPQVIHNDKQRHTRHSSHYLLDFRGMMSGKSDSASPTFMNCLARQRISLSPSGDTRNNLLLDRTFSKPDVASLATPPRLSRPHNDA
jgi:hypothetical protein